METLQDTGAFGIDPTEKPTMTREQEVRRVEGSRRVAPRGRSRRRSVAGLALGGGLLVLATAMAGNANYSDSYLTKQLSQQRITFKPPTPSPRPSGASPAW